MQVTLTLTERQARFLARALDQRTAELRRAAIAAKPGADLTAYREACAETAELRMLVDEALVPAGVAKAA